MLAYLVSREAPGMRASAVLIMRAWVSVAFPKGGVPFPNLDSLVLLVLDILWFYFRVVLSF